MSTRPIGMRGNKDADTAAKQAAGRRRDGQTDTRSDILKKLYSLLDVDV